MLLLLSLFLTPFCLEVGSSRGKLRNVFPLLLDRDETGQVRGCAHLQLRDLGFDPLYALKAGHADAVITVKDELASAQLVEHDGR